jgi:hypothetical protein
VVRHGSQVGTPCGFLTLSWRRGDVKMMKART